jgi:peptidyl-prolyl cis-trans isomerase D
VTRYRGGDIGWLDVGNFSYRWPKAVLGAGYGLDKGAMSGIIETDQGLFVVMKTDFRESAATSFEEARAGLRQEILTKKRRTVEEAFLQETAQLVKPEVMTSALAGIELPASPVKLAPSDEPLPPASPAVLSTSKPN